MSITRGQLVEGVTLITVNGTEVVVICVGLKLVAVRDRTGEVDAWPVYTVLGWSLPKPTKPEWLNTAWLNVGDEQRDCSPEDADKWAPTNRIGRVCLGTGEWVPCKGKEVLG